MKIQNALWILTALGLAAPLVAIAEEPAAPAESAPPAEAPPQMQKMMNLDEFLAEVQRNHLGIRGNFKSMEGGIERSTEGEIQTAWTLITNWNITYDTKAQPGGFAGSGYDSLGNLISSSGIQKQWDFGLLTQLTYNLNWTVYNNARGASFQVSPGLPPFTIPGISNWANVYPQLTLSMPFWANGFGRTVRAAKEATEAGALASSFGAKFQAKMALVQAESAYWRLVLDRQLMKLSQAAVDRVQKIHDWNVQRVKKHLGDKSDELTSEAGLELRKLDMQSTMDELRTASLEFNKARNLDANDVPELLPELDPKMIDDLKIPARAPMRADVKAAEQQQRAAIASATISQEKDKPAVNLQASIAFNGQSGLALPTDPGNAFSQQLLFNHPTTSGGIAISVPLDFGTMIKANSGWAKEKQAAEDNYLRKVFEQDQDWKDLNEKLAEARRHLELSRKVEGIQDQKLERERERLHQGRTTTYQVLLYETDLISAQLSRVRDQATVLNIIAQMKLFGEEL
ncbi:MAG: TolC family protein [Bdellovibrionota bacterium]